MFLARKARMQQYTSVAYGQNDEHPDLEFQDSSADSSSEDENSVPRHAVRIEAYDDLDNVRSVSFWNYYEQENSKLYRNTYFEFSYSRFPDWEDERILVCF